MLMMNSAKISLAILLTSMCFAVYAGDGRKTIDMTFTGTVLQPSCTITFSATGPVDLGTLQVASIRYYKTGQIYNTSPMVKTASSEIFKIRIAGCAANTISKDAAGKQFTFTIAPTTGTWLNSSTSQMGGGIVPASGATDFAARVLVPDTFPTTATPTSWKTFTGAGIAGQADSLNHVTGVTSSVKVALTDLVTSGSGSGQYWEMPVKFDLGMKQQELPGRQYGSFSVSGVITAAYF
jgi:type 1 fimbria pilin